MASFLMKQMVGGKLNEMKGGIDKLTGDKDGEGGEKTESGEDPEVQLSNFTFYFVFFSFCNNKKKRQIVMFN
ncbi:unnamed protein product [Wuchereria bancrofti]|uniref:Uncharacterized protein n=1 Tax=Wuchereria bancrofti TaxID=6293 RepID=A0A3P7FQ16_WUCBA|nr:unnamed protein product [Wuchereria bancrofti]